MANDRALLLNQSSRSTIACTSALRSGVRWSGPATWASGHSGMLVQATVSVRKVRSLTSPAALV